MRDDGRQSVARTEADLGLEAQQAVAIAFVAEMHRFRRDTVDLIDALPEFDEDEADDLDGPERGCGEGGELRGAEAGEPRGELPRRLSILRVLAEREIERLWRTNQLDAGELQRSADLAPRLLAELRALEQQFRATLMSIDDIIPEDREYLLQVVDSLMIRNAPPRAARPIDPRPGVSARVAGYHPREGGFPVLADAGEERQAFHAHVDACTLRALMQEDLRRWRGGGEVADRPALLERIELERAAYQAIVERLQLELETALEAGRDDSAAELAHARNGLLSIFLQLEAAVDGREVSTEPDEGPWTEPGSPAGWVTRDRLMRALWLLVASLVGLAIGIAL